MECSSQFNKNNIFELWLKTIMIGKVFRLDEVASYQRAAVYSQRRAFLTSSEEGMLETFSKYCVQTLDEILAASLTTTG